jgi:phosphate transport system permease protein
MDPLQPGQTMTAAMASLAIGSDQVRGADLAFQSLFFVGLVLFGITLVLNLASERFVRRVREKY